MAFLAGGRLLGRGRVRPLEARPRCSGRTTSTTAGTFHGGTAELLAAASPMGATYADVERAKAILVVGLDAEQEVPLLHLRIRKAARRGARVFVVHPRRTRLWDVAEHELCLPEHQSYVLERIHDGDAPGRDRSRRAPRRRSGRPRARRWSWPATASPSTRSRPTSPSRPRRSSAPGSRSSLAARATAAPCGPACTPRCFRAAAASTRRPSARRWRRSGARCRRRPGRSAREILEACADREVDVLFLVGADPLRDVPDAELARRALSNTPAQGRAVARARRARAVRGRVPAGRRLGRAGGPPHGLGGPPAADAAVRTPAGVSRPDWEIFAGLAEAMGRPLGFGTIEDLRAEAAGLLEPRTVNPRTTAWTGTGPPKRLGELTLLSYPLLVDEGRLSEGAAELKAALGDEAFLEVHPEDAEKRGLVRRRPCGRPDRRRRGRARRSRHRASGQGRAVRPLQPAGPGGEPPALRLVHDRRGDRGRRGRGRRGDGGRSAEGAAVEGAA